MFNPFSLFFNDNKLLLIDSINNNLFNNLAITNDNDDTILHIAAKYGDFQLTNSIINSKYFNNHLLYLQNKQGNTPIHLSTLYNHHNISYLLSPLYDNLLIKNNDGLYVYKRDINNDIINLLVVDYNINIDDATDIFNKLLHKFNNKYPDTSDCFKYHLIKQFILSRIN